MWKKIVLVAVLLLAMSSVYADTVNEANPDYAQDNNSYPKISQIENKLYSKSYAGEDIYRRLDRIENTIFHQNFSSNDLATRVDNISDKVKYSAMPGYLLNDISALEKANFNKIFRNDSPDARLERLEYHLIGAVQDGNYKNRVYQLKSLNDQNNAAAYLDENAYAYDEDYPKIKPHSEGKVTTKLQDILFMVAPFLFGLL